jgi:hypothetical protein
MLLSIILAIIYFTLYVNLHPILPLLIEEKIHFL